MNMKKNIDLNEKQICKLYDGGQSTHQIAKLFKVSRAPIRRILKKHNINIRKIGRTKIYSCNENLFNEDSESSFYLAGFIAADGNIRQQKYSKILKISLAIKDKEHLILIKKIIKSNHPLKVYKVKPNKLTKNKTHFKTIELTITSENIFNDLARFNVIPNKTDTYEMPKWIINHPLVNHFIRGYIDGDGSIFQSKRKICSNPQISMSLIGNYNVLNDINNIFIKNCNINGSLIKHKPTTKHTYRIRYSGNIQLKKIGNFLYKNSNYYMKRKYLKIKMLLESIVQMEP